MVNSNQGMKIYKGISQQQKCGGHSFFFQLRSKAENPINITILQPIFGNFKIIKSTCINKYCEIIHAQKFFSKWIQVIKDL